MRWQPKPDSHPYEAPWWVGLIVIAISPALAILAACLGLLWCKRWLMGPTGEWRPWFAWYPVEVSPWPEQEKVWFEWIERRSGHLLGDAVHRSVEKPAPDAQPLCNGGGER